MGRHRDILKGGGRREDKIEECNRVQHAQASTTVLEFVCIALLSGIRKMKKELCRDATTVLRIWTAARVTSQMATIKTEWR